MGIHRAAVQVQRVLQFDLRRPNFKLSVIMLPSKKGSAQGIARRQSASLGEEIDIVYISSEHEVQVRKELPPGLQEGKDPALQIGGEGLLQPTVPNDSAQYEYCYVAEVRHP